MNHMPTVHAYTITGDFDQSVKFALAHFTTRTGRLPAAVWLHSDRIPADWPAAWPPVQPNDKLNRNIIALQPAQPEPAVQLSLI